MVNLAFCRLDSSYPIRSDHSEAQHSSISIFQFPSAGRSFMLEFLRRSSKNHLISVLSKCICLFWSSAVRISFSRRDLRFSLILRVDQFISLILDHDPICWMLWHHDGFFQTTAGFRSDRGHLIFLNFLGSF